MAGDLQMTTAYKIWFGDYVNLYRSARRTLKTDWTLEVGRRLVAPEIRPLADKTYIIGTPTLRFRHLNLGDEGIKIWDVKNGIDVYWDIVSSFRKLGWIYWDEFGEGTTIFEADPEAKTCGMLSTFYPLGVSGTYSLGSLGKEWKDLFIDGIAYIDVAEIHDDLRITTLEDVDADETNTLVDSETLTLRGKYWDGVSSIDRDAVILHDIIDTTPKSQIGFEIAGTRIANLKDDKTFNIDKINELTVDAGVTIEKVLLKDQSIADVNYVEGRSDYPLILMSPLSYPYPPVEPIYGIGVYRDRVLFVAFDLIDLRGAKLDNVSDVNFKKQIRVADDTYAGIVTTDAGGNATITFTAHMGTTKPVVILTPELDPATGTVFAQISGWTQDVAGNYTGVTIRTSDELGKPAPSVPVHFMVIRKSAL